MPTLDTIAPPSAAPSLALPEGVREGNENLIRLTESAGVKVAALIARDRQGEFLRVAISGGGCNGLAYKIKVVQDPKKRDNLLPTPGVEAIGGRESAPFLTSTLF